MMIQTARLDLAPVDLTDAEAAMQGDRLAAWAVDYPTEGDLVIARLVADGVTLGADPYVPYKVTVRDTGTVVGGCGFLGPPDSTGAVEIGYGLAPSHRGQGIATEAVVGLVKETWKDPRVKLVIAFTDADNEPSQAVLRRAGFHVVVSEGEQLRWEAGRQA